MLVMADSQDCLIENPVRLIFTRADFKHYVH